MKAILTYTINGKRRESFDVIAESDRVEIGNQILVDGNVFAIDVKLRFAARTVSWPMRLVYLFFPSLVTFSNLEFDDE